MAFAVRTNRSGGDGTAVKGQIRKVDSQLPIPKCKRGEVAASFAARRFNKLLLSLFCRAALLLAAVGVYG